MGVESEKSCTLYTEIRNQAENSYVCPYTVVTRLISTLFMLSVNHYLGNSFVLYWTPCASQVLMSGEAVQLFSEGM